ncbi:MAG: cytidylyltransferase domain-containing protein [Spirochaetota bacterium]
MEKSVMAFVPVRGGSKSIPLKNIKPFCGRPLLYWTLHALQKSTMVDRIIVATDSDVIKDTALSFRFNKVTVYDRAPENAADTSSTESVMLEYLSAARPDEEDIFMLVQATSPMTTSDDIDGALDLYRSGAADSVLSAVRTKSFFWKEDGTPLNYDYRNRPRRQDFDGLLQENGALYINTAGNVLRDRNRLSGTIAVYEMPAYTAFEIDEEDDWMICEALMRRHVLKREKGPRLVKLFLTDVDGVLTDTGMYYSEHGDELKKFSTLDGKAFELLRDAGIKTGIITAEETNIVENRARKIKADYLFQGARDKLSLVQTLCRDIGITLDEVAYIGDDVNDTGLLQSVGMAATPANGVRQNREIPGILLLASRGGNGAVREFAEYILSAY